MSPGTSSSKSCGPYEFSCVEVDGVMGGGKNMCLLFHFFFVVPNPLYFTSGISDNYDQLCIIVKKSTTQVSMLIPFFFCTAGILLPSTAFACSLKVTK